MYSHFEINYIYTHLHNLYTHSDVFGATGLTISKKIWCKDLRVKVAAASRLRPNSTYTNFQHPY